MLTTMRLDEQKAAGRDEQKAAGRDEQKAAGRDELRAAGLDGLKAAGLVRPATRLERRPAGPSPLDRRPSQPDRPLADPSRLEELRAAGLVRVATEPAGVGVDQMVPVAPALRPLFGGGGLRRGSTVALTGATALATGSTSLLFALLAEASAAGSWCAVVGLPQLGLVAAAEAGVALDRVALVPQPGPEWPAVVGALLDGVEIVVAAAPGGVSASMTGRLAARARQRAAVLIAVGSRWPGADLTLEVVRGAWHGLESGRGRLRRYEAEVLAYGRGAATRPRRARFWLAGPTSRRPMLMDPVETRDSIVDSTPLRLAG